MVQQYSLNDEITWDLVSHIEPSLQALEKLVRAVRDDPDQASFCANSVWYGGAKVWLLDLVGWSRGFAPEAKDPNEVPRLITGAELMALGDRKPSPIESDWEAVLRTPGAYDVAYEHLYELLPYCRNCGCA